MVNKTEDDKNLNKILIASFNQDGSCFSIGTESGFKIYSTNPFRENFDRELEGGIGICEMLYKSNIHALVGGGKTPKYPHYKVILWDDSQSKVVSEFRFTSYVRNAKLKKDRFIIICDQKIYVFNLLNLQNIDTIDTFDNNKGLIAFLMILRIMYLLILIRAKELLWLSIMIKIQPQLFMLMNLQ